MMNPPTASDTNIVAKSYRSALSAIALSMALGSVGCAADVGADVGDADLEVRQTTQAVSAGRVVAYVDGTVGHIDTSKLSAGKYTHINYAFANLDAWGNVYFTYGQQDINIINQLKALKSSNPNLKIILAIGGWTWSDHFSTVAGDAGRRANFVNTAWSLVNQHGLDGIEIDWEFPGYGGEAGNSICWGTCDGQRFIWLLNDLKNAKPGGKVLSFAGGASPQMGANVNLGQAAALTDFLTIMTYDFHGDWGEPWGHHANLYGGDISVDSAVNMYLNAGVPANKLVVGLPFYGRSWNAPAVPGGAPLYRDIHCNGTSAGSWCTFYGYGGTLGYDNNLKAAFINTGSQWVSFDNTVSMGWKLDYINNRNLGGAMYWSAMQDKSNLELTNLVWSKIGGGGGGGPTSGALVFNAGDANHASPTEWDSGRYKGACGARSVVIGLSQNTSLTSAHAILCAPNNIFTGNYVTTVSNVSSGDHRRFARAGDWDPGYYKSECGYNEYVSGISMVPATKKIHGLRCASASMAAGGTASCETRLVTQDDRGQTTFGDWDYGHYKAQCGPGKVVMGVSTNTSTGMPHRILCCGF